MTHDAVVLLGFGGPQQPDEIRPFLDRVLAGRTIPASRYETVVDHYVHIGGKSPFNELTQRQARALARELRSRGHDVPVETAYLHAAPFAADVDRELHDCGAEHPLAIVLASFQSPVSYDKYLNRITGADYTPPFFDHPLFVEAYVDRIREALQRLDRRDFAQTELIFTAHSIPQAMADSSPYVQQYTRSAQLIAKQAGATSWTLTYQSRSGSPAEPWLEPDVYSVIRNVPERGRDAAVLAPIGFLSDHVEVLYDLDVDAANVADEAGVRLARAGTLNDHPIFIRMLADLIEQCGV
jgi:ferrochelatase